MNAVTDPRPWGVILTDKKFSMLGYEWCLAMEYEDIDGGWSPVVWVQDSSGAWTPAGINLNNFHFGPDAAVFKTKWTSPLNYLVQLCAAVTAGIHALATIPLPTPGDPISRTLFHAKLTPVCDGVTLSMPDGGLSP